MKLTLRPRFARAAASPSRRSRRQHSSNLLLILLAGLIVFNIRSFLFGLDPALKGYTDFSQFYAAATIVREGQGEHLYTYTKQEETQSRLFSTADSRSGPLLYFHPPFEVLIFLPLANFSYETAYLIWLLINLFLLAAAGALLLPCLRELRPVFSLNLFLSFFAFFPIFIAVYHGQDALVLLMLFVSALVSLKSGRCFLAGTLLGLGLFRFHVVAPFMLLFLFKRQWRVLLGFLVTATLAISVSVLVTGWQGMIRYAQFLWEVNQHLGDRAHQVRYAIYPRAMVTLRGLLYSLFDSNVSDTLITIVSSSFSFLVLIWFYTHLRKSSAEADIDLEFSLGIAVTLLAGFYLHLYDWSLLLLPILLLSNRFASSERPRGLRLWTLRLGILLLLMTPVYVVLIHLELISVLVIPLLLFAGLIASELARNRTAPREPHTANLA